MSNPTLRIKPKGREGRGSANFPTEEKKQQVLSLGQLGWSLRRIQGETGVRRETDAGLVRVTPNFRPLRCHQFNYYELQGGSCWTTAIKHLH